MTREETLNQLKLELSRWESDCKSYHKTKDALKYAIKELEQETTSRESYESEYLARKQAEYELWKIKEQLKQARRELDELPIYGAKFTDDFRIHLDREEVFSILDKLIAESED